MYIYKSEFSILILSQSLTAQEAYRLHVPYGTNSVQLNLKKKHSSFTASKFFTGWIRLRFASIVGNVSDTKVV